MKIILDKIHIPLQFLTSGNYSTVSSKFEKNNMLHVVDYNCYGSREALSKAAEAKRMGYKQKWLVLMNSTYYDIQFELENMEIRFDSDLKMVTSSLTIYDVFNTGFGKNGSLIMNYYGYWKSSEGNLVIDDSLNRYHQKSILSGVILTTSTVITNPYVNGTIEEYFQDMKPVDMISKFSYRIFQHFKEIHNFTHIQYSRDKWFGNDVGGFEDGVAKDVYEEITDMASTCALIKHSRVEFYDFVNPMYRFSSTFIFRNIGSYDLWKNEFLKPFTTTTWISILLVLTFLSAAVKITNWVETIYMRSRKSFSWLSAVLMTISIICQQGTSFLPTHLTSRFLFFILLTLSFLLYNYYTSSIVSALLNNKPRELTTFQDLIKSGLQLGIQMAPYTITIFETNMDVDIQCIRRLVFPKDREAHVWNVSDGIEKVRTGPYAYHMEAARAYEEIAKTFDAQAICEVSDKISLIPASYLSFLLKKDSQYRNLLKMSLRKMEETGIIHRYRQIWEGKKPPCFANAILLSVGLDQTFIAFFFLSIGYFMAILILVLERITFNSKMNRTILKSEN
ncbi:hypothetical protein HHI36_018516 [Cryptolaemus montrouzieri]|uniref:Uncharacterized protein n=1 Tax=Cryptolaemus montrouzieri TaxID=559131 RepID=A0ABD2P116_9CUCU